MDGRILSLSHSHYTICSVLYQYNTQNQCDLYTDEYNKNQTGWLITLYKMGPGQAMMLYTSSLYFTLICFIEVQSKL